MRVLTWTLKVEELYSASEVTTLVRAARPTSLILWWIKGEEHTLDVRAYLFVKSESPVGELALLIVEKR